jgi:hypothetical protein
MEIILDDSRTAHGWVWNDAEKSTENVSGSGGKNLLKTQKARKNGDFVSNGIFMQTRRFLGDSMIKKVFASHLSECLVCGVRSCE